MNSIDLLNLLKTSKNENFLKEKDTFDIKAKINQL